VTPVVLAHGIGTRGDLPLPAWMFAYGAGFAVVASFLLLRLLWPGPRLARAAIGGALGGWTRPAGAAGEAILRTAGLAALAVTVWAAFAGGDTTVDNIAPVALFVAFWVGVQVVSVVLGDVWATANPLDTIAAAIHRVSGRAHEPSAGADHPWGAWPAVATLGAFLWFELAYHDPSSPRAVGTFVVLYSATVLVGAARFGRGWIANGDGFAALFALLGKIGVFHRDDDGQLRMRPPLAGLTTIEPRPGLEALVLVTLGATSFDGMTRTSFWLDVLGSSEGWSATLINTVGLLWVVGIVAALYRAAMWGAAKVVGGDSRALATQFLHALVPIVFAYALAHYFSLLMFEGQTFLALASDPLGRGWDLFGTAHWEINFRLVTTTTIAWVQACAIAGGHVAGVITAHDRAVELYDHRTAVASQVPVLGVMVVYTVGGLLLLLNA